MKLSLLFVAFVSAKKDLTPTEQLEKLKGHIDFVWGEWYGNCQAGRETRRTNFKKLIDRMGKQYTLCGTDAEEVDDGRKRRDTDADLCDDPTKCRISKVDKSKANKQLGNLMNKFAERYFTTCTKKLTIERVAQKAAKWTASMNRMKCAGGSGTKEVQVRGGYGYTANRPVHGGYPYGGHGSTGYGGRGR